MAYTNEALGKALEDLTAAYQHFLDKAKDAAIAAMSDTVIAQVKQDAKEHIASELAEQKGVLEKAIEAAKIALRNSVIEADSAFKQTVEAKKSELTALVTTAENTLNEKGSLWEKRIHDTLEASFEKDIKALDTRFNDAQTAIAQQLANAQKEISQAALDFNQGLQAALLSFGPVGEVRFFSHPDYTPGFLYANGASFIPELYPDYYTLWQKLHNNPKSESYCGYDRFGYPKTPDLRKNAPSPLHPFIKV